MNYDHVKAWALYECTAFYHDYSVDHLILYVKNVYIGVNVTVQVSTQPFMEKEIKGN